MIGLDTNVLMRYIAQDDATQSPVASEIMAGLSPENPGFISSVSLVELVWVMQRCYKAPRPEVATILEHLLRTQELVVENAETAIQALNLFTASNADFSDCLIERSGNRAGCGPTLTFDANAAKSAGMRIAV